MYIHLCMLYIHIVLMIHLTINLYYYTTTAPYIFFVFFFFFWPFRSQTKFWTYFADASRRLMIIIFPFFIFIFSYLSITKFCRRCKCSLRGGAERDPYLFISANGNCGNQRSQQQQPKRTIQRTHSTNISKPNAYIAAFHYSELIRKERKLYWKYLQESEWFERCASMTCQSHRN